MRSKLGTALSALGGFLVFVAILGMFYAPGQLMRTPLDVDQTTNLEGEGTLGGDTLPVKAFSVTLTDSEKSDDDVVVWTNSSCLVLDEGDIDQCVSADDPEERLLSATTDNFASDRYTGIAVNDPKYLPAEAEPHEGLVNKWPFESEKKDYEYWDGTAKTAVTATYDREETLDGLKTYVYKVDVSDLPIEISEGTPGTYDDQKEIWVEPLTGSIVKQVDSQVRYNADGEEVLALQLAFTEDEVAESVDDAASKSGLLRLATSTIPIIGFAVGIPLIIIGVFLIVSSRKKNESSEPAAA